MNRRCVHVEIELAISTDEWLSLCEGAVETMRSVAGLEWKLWLVEPGKAQAGGVYLFSSVEAAEAYVNGPTLSGLRASPAVKAMNVRITPVVDSLSIRTLGVRAA